MQSYAYKIVIVGPAAVGKSTWINRHKTGNYTKEYIPTIGVEVHPLSFYMSDGSRVALNVWDCAGQEKFASLRNGYYINAQGAIIMFDIAAKSTYEEMKNDDGKWWTNPELKGKPSVLCGNKVDNKYRQVDPTFLQSDLPKLEKKVGEKIKYIEISARSNYHFDKPFLHLIRKLRGDDTLEFVSPPTVVPPEVEGLNEFISTL